MSAIRFKPALWCMGWHLLVLALSWGPLLKLGCQAQEKIKVCVCIVCMSK